MKFKHLILLNSFLISGAAVIPVEKTAFVGPDRITDAIRDRDIGSDNGHRVQILKLLKSFDNNTVTDDSIKKLLTGVTGTNKDDVVRAAMVAAYGYSVTKLRTSELRNTAQDVIKTVRRSTGVEKDRILTALAFFRDAIDNTTYPTVDAGVAIDRASTRTSDESRRTPFAQAGK